MIGNHTPSKSGWVKGRGRTAKWRAIDQNQITFEPQFLIEKITHRELYPEDSAKLAFVDVTSAINSRTCVASVIPALPCGGSAPRYIAKNGAVELFYLSGWVNSLPVDLIFRLFVNGLHLKPYHMEDIYASTDIIIIQSIAKLAQSIHGFPESVSDVIHTTSALSAAPSYFLANHAFHRKRVLSMIDALVSYSMGLSMTEVLWIINDCGHESPNNLINPDKRGFWRVDATSPPESRQTTLFAMAYHDLVEMVEVDGKEEAVKKFLDSNNGLGWMPKNHDNYEFLSTYLRPFSRISYEEEEFKLDDDCMEVEAFLNEHPPLEIRKN